MTPQELRNSIFQLAIQGRLVEQRPEEGMALDLYREIQEEKQRLIKEGKIKEEKSLPEITEEEKPFEIPGSWTWVKLGNIVHYTMGKTPSRAESQWWGQGIPWVSIADMLENGHIQQTKETVTDIAVSELFGGNLSKAGTLLMSFKLTVGRVSILDIDAVHNEAIISIYPLCDNEKIMQQYLFKILPFISQFGDSKNAIKGKTLNRTSISNMLIALPPIAEQERIVSKIEEFLPYIDRYEQAWSRLKVLNQRFPDDMRKSIFQLAIQGKLVEQRPEEGSAEELYREIQAEKQWLIKEGKIKKEKKLPEIVEEEKLFEIPKSWMWVRFYELMNSMSTGPFGSMLHKSDYVPNGIPVVNPANIVDGKIIPSEKMMVSADTAKKLNSYTLCSGALIMGRRGEMGRCAVVTDCENGWLCGTGAFLMMPSSHLFVYFISVFFKTPYAKSYLAGESIGTTMDNLNHNILSGLPVPLPPLAEQKRIVARLEELLAVCEKLK